MRSEPWSQDGPWAAIFAEPRWRPDDLSRKAVPDRPGVYVWFRDGRPIYAGRAIGQGGLRERVWDKHLATRPDLSRSSFRRNVCELLGIADTAVTRARPPRLSPDEVEPVNSWIRECEVSWFVCGSVEDAEQLERSLFEIGRAHV